jgi:hypothetical protein
MGGDDPPNTNDPPDDIDSEEDEDLAESRSWLGTKAVANKSGQWVEGHFVENVQGPTVQLRAQKMTRVGYLIIPPAGDQSSVVVSRRGNSAVSFRFSQTHDIAAFQTALDKQQQTFGRTRKADSSLSWKCRWSHEVLLLPSSY